MPPVFQHGSSIVTKLARWLQPKQIEKHYPSLKKEKLPKLPVPELQDTIRKYLEYASVIVPEPDLIKTKKLAEAFQNGPGKTAQRELAIIANNTPNWHNKFWLPDMYLRCRGPLPVFSNPAYLFPRTTFPTKDDMFKYIAVLVQGVMSYKQLLDRREIPLDQSTGKQGGQPMCMDQYWRMFSSHREACTDEDLQYTLMEKPMDGFFILMIRSLMFKIQTVDQGCALNTEAIFKQVREAHNAAQDYSQSGPSSVGLMTAVERNKAARLKEALFNIDPRNKASWDIIRKADFIVCADRQVKISEDENPDPVSVEDELHHLLHGRGTPSEACNRWFDKTQQFIITEDGSVGLNFEHSIAEGIVLVNMVEYLLQYIDQNINKKFVGELKSKTVPLQLTWTIDENLHNDLKDCAEDMDQLANDLQLSVLEYQKFGKKFFKSKKFSPDAGIQLCMQYAHYKSHLALASTYESASTRRFQFGRVDNIRSAHPQALAWVKIMADKTADWDTKKKSFQAALKKQSAVMIENVTGYGIDNHLSALREVSKQMKLDMEFFDDDTFKEIIRFPLSTSQVPLATEGTYVCYGPVTLDGYGCCYNPKDDSIAFVISALKSNPRTDIDTFRNSLISSLEEVEELLGL